MSEETPTAGAGQQRPAPALRPAEVIDAQILANWQALRGNPDADAHQVMQAIDRLLDERPAPPGHRVASAPPATAPGTRRAGRSARPGIIHDVLGMLLRGE